MASSQQRPGLREQVFGLTKAPGLYPLKGIYYFLTHRYLWPLLRARLIPALILSIFVLTILFVFAYLPQVAFLALFHGRTGAWINGTFLTLGEGSILIALLFEAFLVDETQVDVFDAVLVSEGFESLVQEGRPVKPAAARDEDGNMVTYDPLKRLGRPTRKAQYAPFSFRQIVELVLLLPVTFIPIAGIPLFLLGTGYRAGQLLGWRYYQLRSFTKKERQSWIKPRRWSYCWFGLIAMILQFVPPFSMLFLITTAAGSALFAAKLEKQRLLLEGRDQAGQSDGAQRVSIEDQTYTDDPV